jgi:hypothetical protein
MANLPALSWNSATAPEIIMPNASIRPLLRPRLLAGIVVCACALLSACGQSRRDESAPTPSASASSNESSQSQALQSNELQDWARQATSGESPRQADHAAVARNTSDALATPVFHTVD